jgi:DNA-binding CsgD family transcriptional regulator
MADDLVDLRGALSELLSTGQLSPAVRPEIGASWHRSIASDVRRDRLVVPYLAESRGEDRLERAARPVLERLAEELQSTSMSVLLTDPQGLILERHVQDGALRARLDRIMLAPGFSYDESQIGTNAIGTTLEQASALIVLGDEHYADELIRMACAAAPIVDPATGSVLGAIDLTCGVEASHPLMLALARRAARDIEQCLVSANPAAGRALLDSFLHARRGARGPLVALNDQTMYTNAPAVKLVQGVDRAVLWELVWSALAGRERADLQLPLGDGATGFAACETILDGGEVVGAMLRFVPVPRADADPDGNGGNGDRLRTRHGVGWDSLTETERIVAELVSQGRTNRQVAAMTFLSPHTVGYHLRHIFYKLGVNSRVDLTRLMVQRTHDEG